MPCVQPVISYRIVWHSRQTKKYFCSSCVLFLKKKKQFRWCSQITRKFEYSVELISVRCRSYLCITVTFKCIVIVLCKVFFLAFILFVSIIFLCFVSIHIIRFITRCEEKQKHANLLIDSDEIIKKLNIDWKKVDSEIFLLQSVHLSVWYWDYSVRISPVEFALQKKTKKSRINNA